ncbi:unnamed protein product, partial [Meganyctiphanes norvegica]
MTISGIFLVVLVMAVVAAVRAAMINATNSNNVNSTLITASSLLLDAVDDDDPGEIEEETIEYQDVWNYDDTYLYNYNYESEYLNALKKENNTLSNDVREIESHQALNTSENEIMPRNTTVIKWSLMERFGFPNIVHNISHFSVYEIIRNAQEQGYTFTTEEETVLQEELMKTECVDINDYEIPGCHNKTYSSSDFLYNKVRYMLWTKNNSDDYKFHLIDEHGPGSFNSSHHTYIIIHGFWNSGEVYWILDAKKAILKKEREANVIAVDWYSLAGFPSPYGRAVENLYKVAEITADLIVYLSKIVDLQTSKISMVGHSLGAHLAGMTAKYIRKRSSALKPIARITGLDPAGPSFFNKPSTMKLDKTDADFVDVIHTNGGEGVGVIRAFFTSTYGYLTPLGHVDFYPNGGRMQPGCWRVYLWCSHSHAYLYWLESINATFPRVYEAWPCDSWSNFRKGKCHKCNGKCPEMGFSLNKDTRKIVCIYYTWERKT